jgi:hypothetical protein
VFIQLGLESYCTKLRTGKKKISFIKSVEFLDQESDAAL